MLKVQDMCGFGSWHPGITNFLFGDGSVHTIVDSISTTTWYALNTMNGGETLGSDF
jgi:prepilin-type processing-associated H-X9-DG protein